MTCQFFRWAEPVARAALSGDSMARFKLIRALNFPEVKEIRFGYTRVGHNGRGIGNGVVSRAVISAYMKYRELRRILNTEPDALQMVPLIGMDRVSDALATVSKSILISFTQYCARVYRFDPACIRTVDIHGVWDPVRQRMVTVRAEVPVDDAGEPILLVPKWIVRSGPAMGAAGYFDDLRPRGAPRGEVDKSDALDDAEDHPGRLGRFVKESVKDLNPRRDLMPRKRRVK